MKLVDVYQRAYGYISIQTIEIIEQQNREIIELKEKLRKYEQPQLVR